MSLETKFLPKLAVVIVNYNSYDDCSACVTSILNLNIVRSEHIIIVDNHSPDRSGVRLANQFPEVNVLLSNKNTGFGGGVNIGIRSLCAARYLVLNPDTRFEENRIGEVMQIFDVRPKIGLIGLNLIYPDGTPQYSARRFYSFMTVLLRRTSLKNLEAFRQINKDHLLIDAWQNGVFECDWVMGTGFVISRQAFDDVDGMDEDYFLYMEDTDLCFRLWQQGWYVAAIPSVKLVHDHQRASSQGLLSFATRQHFRSLCLFIRKHGMPLIGHGKRPEVT